MNTQFLEIYRKEGMICGEPLRGVTTYQLRLEYENCFNFPGQTACFFFVSRDDTIGREEALAFATLIAKGGTICINVDISSVNTVRELRSPQWKEVKKWETDYVKNVDA